MLGLAEKMSLKCFFFVCLSDPHQQAFKMQLILQTIIFLVHAADDSPFLCTNGIDFQDCGKEKLVNKFTYRQNIIQLTEDGKFNGIHKQEKDLIFQTEKDVPRTG